MSIPFANIRSNYCFDVYATPTNTKHVILQPYFNTSHISIHRVDNSVDNVDNFISIYPIFLLISAVHAT